MLDIIVCGALGRMGREVTQLIEADPGLRLAAAIDRTGGAGVLTELGAYSGPAHVLVDFSVHTAALDIMNYCVGRGLPAVMATTGYTDEEQAAIEAASGHIPIFQSANMSVGVHLLCALVSQATALLSGSDIEIVETHHSGKQDAPSGTALMLARAVTAHRPDARLVGGRWGKGGREPRDIGMHALRMGSIVGRHEVLFSDGCQTLTLRHETHDRAVYARGALEAAAFLATQPKGLYDMAHLVSAETTHIGDCL